MKPLLHLRSLDALRGILAVYVVLHHARWLLWSGFDLWGVVPHPVWQKLLAYGVATSLRFGHEAVMVFFVLSGFFIHPRAAEDTEGPTGQTGWAFAKNASKSKTALTGLISGKRYWLRVLANGTAGPRPASDPATKTAP